MIGLLRPVGRWFSLALLRSPGLVALRVHITLWHAIAPDARQDGFPANHTDDDVVLLRHAANIRASAYRRTRILSLLCTADGYWHLVPVVGEAV